MDLYQRISMYLVVYLSMLVFGLVSSQSRETKQKWHRTELADPQKDWNKCGRHMKSWICDPNNILKAEEADQLDDLIEKVRNTTKCPCADNTCEKDKRGYQITIALIPNITWDVESEGDPRPSDKDALINGNLYEAEKFAYTLLNKWNPGRCEEGLVIFYCLFDNVLYTVTDQVTKRMLTDNKVGQIAWDNRQLFGRNTKIFEGLRVLITEYKDVFDGVYKARVVNPVTPANPQAVVGAAASSLNSIYMLCTTALFALLLLC